jgi:hypothetical protein
LKTGSTTLHARGILSDDEFQPAKRRVLDCEPVRSTSEPPSAGKSRQVESANRSLNRSVAEHLAGENDLVSIHEGRVGRSGVAA